MKFQSGKGAVNVPTLNNWVITLNGLEVIYSTLVKKFNIRHMKTRNFNQDPVENFFGQMRQQGCRNINPTATLFHNHFKTLLINNLATRHSISGNCEEDTSRIITNVENFLMQNVSEKKSFQGFQFVLNSKKTLLDKIKILPIAYVSGWLCKYLKTIYKCSFCKHNLICDEPDKEWHDLV